MNDLFLLLKPSSSPNDRIAAYAERASVRALYKELYALGPGSPQGLTCKGLKKACVATIRWVLAIGSPSAMGLGPERWSAADYRFLIACERSDMLRFKNRDASSTRWV